MIKDHCLASVSKMQLRVRKKVWIILKTLKKALILQTMLSCNQMQLQAVIEQVLLQGGGEQLSLGTISFTRTWSILTRSKHKQEILCLYRQGLASTEEQPGAVSLKEVQVLILLPGAPRKTGCMCLFLSLTPLLASTSVAHHSWSLQRSKRLWTNSGYCIQSVWALLCF